MSLGTFGFRTAYIHLLWLAEGLHPLLFKGLSFGMKHDQIISVTFQYYLLNSALAVASNEEVLVPSVLLFNAANSSVLDLSMR